MTRRSMALRSWRTLPGQGKRWHSCSASADIRLRRRLCLAVKLLEEPFDQQRNVLRPLAQRRHDESGTICKR